jgi:protein-disulfide isomerase
MKGGATRTVRTRFDLTVRVLIITAALGVGVGPACAEPDQGLPSEVEALKGELARVQTTLDGILKEQERLRQLLSQRPSPPPRPPEVMARISVAGSPMLGNPEAPLTLVEFSDYQCPYCARFAQTTLPALKAEYIDTGELRYVFRDFPLDRTHPLARKAAEAAHYAGEQGHYWAMHDLLFRHQKALQREQLQTYAQHLGLDAMAFDTCIEQGKYAAAVQQDLDDAAAAGVRGTPGFSLGRSGPDGTLQGVAIKGAQPLTAFREAIERLLKAQP